eukprot:COSAG01_NODE_6421_length_3676_cov_1.876992_2_plen_392_part_00
MATLTLSYRLALARQELQQYYTRLFAKEEVLAHPETLRTFGVDRDTLDHAVAVKLKKRRDSDSSTSSAAASPRRSPQLQGRRSDEEQVRMRRGRASRDTHDTLMLKPVASGATHPAATKQPIVQETCDNTKCDRVCLCVSVSVCQPLRLGTHWALHGVLDALGGHQGTGTPSRLGSPVAHGRVQAEVLKWQEWKAQASPGGEPLRRRRGSSLEEMQLQRQQQMLSQPFVQRTPTRQPSPDVAGAEAAAAGAIADRRVDPASSTPQDTEPDDVDHGSEGWVDMDASLRDELPSPTLEEVEDDQQHQPTPPPARFRAEVIGTDHEHSAAAADDGGHLQRLEEQVAALTAKNAELLDQLQAARDSAPLVKSPLRQEGGTEPQARILPLEVLCNF